VVNIPSPAAKPAFDRPMMKAPRNGRRVTWLSRVSGRIVRLRGGRMRAGGGFVRLSDGVWHARLFHDSSTSHGSFSRPSRP
jgi:hypothetical protein